MRLTTVSIQRPDGTTIATGLAVQVDQASTREVLEHRDLEGFRGVDLYRVYTQAWPVTLIQRQDLLVDESFTDYETGAAFHYRVTGRPKNFDRDHQECYVEVVVGA